MNVVLASLNAGKVHEFNSLLTNNGITLISQATLAINDIEETGLSFVENAILKARHAARAANMPALADDSGLCVTALHGAPGIYSARYAGVGATSSANINKLLLAMKETPEHKRHAFFQCVLVYMAHADDPAPFICQGRWHGVIAREPVGEKGFGYDPIFYLPQLQLTAAQLSPAIKNEISHRGQALQALLAALKETS